MLRADNPVSRKLIDVKKYARETVAYLLARRVAIPLYTRQLLLHRLCHRPTALQLSMRRRTRNAAILWVLPESHHMLGYGMLWQNSDT